PEGDGLGQLGHRPGGVVGVVPQRGADRPGGDAGGPAGSALPPRHATATVARGCDIAGGVARLPPVRRPVRSAAHGGWRTAENRGGDVHTEIAPGVLQIDTLLGGWHQVTAGYLVTGDAPVLVETGSQTSVPHLLAALAELGVDPGELAGVAVTHIHLDHAGGVGDVAAAFPEATIYVHERGARHLVDPTRLVSSAAMVYGDLLDSLYGRLTPTPAERVK